MSAPQTALLVIGYTALVFEGVSCAALIFCLATAREEKVVFWGVCMLAGYLVMLVARVVHEVMPP